MGRPHSFVRLLFPFVILTLLISSGCSSETAPPVTQGSADQVSTVSPTKEGAVPITTDPGTSRTTPLPLNTLISIPGWDIQVLEFLRGADALNIINTPERQAQPLPEGQEYALAKIYLKCTAIDDNYHSLGISDIFITGSSNVAYGDMLDGWPQPEFLYEDMYTADELEGWIDAVIPTDEQNLMVALNVTQDDVHYTRYIALQDGASISLPSELAALNPNDLGVGYSRPAQAGQTVITPDWEVTLLSSLSGAEADAAMGKGTSDYTPPSEGMEYLLLQVRVNYISTNDVPVWIGGDNFYPIDTANGWRLKVDWIYPYGQTDRVRLGKTLLPGAETEGWVFMTIPSGTSQPVIAFDPDYSSSQKIDGNLRYLLVK
jgi:hypothetical protein